MSNSVCLICWLAKAVFILVQKLIVRGWKDSHSGSLISSFGQWWPWVPGLTLGQAPVPGWAQGWAGPRRGLKMVGERRAGRRPSRQAPNVPAGERLKKDLNLMRCPQATVAKWCRDHLELPAKRHFLLIWQQYYRKPLQELMDTAHPHSWSSDGDTPYLPGSWGD